MNPRKAVTTPRPVTTDPAAGTPLDLDAAMPPGTSRRIRRFSVRKFPWPPVVSLLVVLAFWEWFGRKMDPIFASYPTAIAKAFKVLMADGTLPTAFYDSMRPMFVGFAVAALIGIPVGLLVGRYKWIESGLGFYVTAGYATPMVALIPLFLLWFGLGFSVKVAIVVVMAVFPIVISTWAGVRAVPKTMVEVGKSFVASESAILRKIIVPCTLPHIMTGLRLAIGRAVIGIVIAEFFTALSGLGAIIIRSGQQFDTATMFVPVIVLMVLGVGLTQLVGWLEGKVAPWQAENGGRNE
jgi:ABC-type nitrate/sulfonate/bicarbonate transport system permease component